jgi:hypothetical protein
MAKELRVANQDCSSAAVANSWSESSTSDEEDCETRGTLAMARLAGQAFMEGARHTARPWELHEGNAGDGSSAAEAPLVCHNSGMTTWSNSGAVALQMNRGDAESCSTSNEESE